MMNAHFQELQILLAEDNPSDAELIMDALREAGLINRVQWVKDGAEALEVLFGHGDASAPTTAADIRRLRLVLLDLRIPKVDGFEVLHALRADARTRTLPVVALTSSHDEVDVVRAYDLGINSYLVKPVESEAFMKTVKELGLYWMRLNKQPGETH